MELEPVANRSGPSTITPLRQRRNIGRWCWRRGTEDVFEQPLAAQDWRGPIGIRRDREQAPMAQQPAALVRVRQRDPSEAAPINTRNTVVPGEPFVQERVTRAQQLGHASVLMDLAVDEQLGFALKRFAKAV